jgi:hypothetical protein
MESNFTLSEETMTLVMSGDYWCIDGIIVKAQPDVEDLTVLGSLEIEGQMTFKEACDSGMPFYIGDTPQTQRLCGYYWYTQEILFNWVHPTEEWRMSVWNIFPTTQVASIGVSVVDYFEDHRATHNSTDRTPAQPAPEPECRCVTLLSGHWQGCHMAKLGYM